MCAADHVVRFTRLSPSVFAYCKRSKTGAGEGLGTRLSIWSKNLRNFEQQAARHMPDTVEAFTMLTITLLP